MIILICAFIITLIAVVLGLESESDTNQPTELIPLSIPVDEAALSHRSRNRSYQFFRHK